MDGQWWQSGFDAPAVQGNSYPQCKTRNRFWLKPGESRQVVFLTARPSFCIYEHNVKINGRWGFFATCLGMIDQPCALCDAGNYRSGIAVFTILDLQPFTDKKGKEHEVTRRLYIAKSATLQVLQHQIKQREKMGQSLRGATYEITRTTGDKIPVVGNCFDFQEMVNLGMFDGVESTDEFDYADLFKPDPELVKHYARSLSGTGSLGDGAKQVQY